MRIVSVPFHRTLGGLLVIGLSLAACAGGGGATSGVAAPEASGSSSSSSASLGTGSSSGSAVGDVPIRHPILFVTQVPVNIDFAARMSTFANHPSTIEAVPRGGDLVIRYPDGRLRKLTEEAGFGSDGLQGEKAIAVREPSMHWSGTKALFSMVVGAPTVRYTEAATRWQIYEVTGLGPDDTVRITKVPHQPAEYHNITPFYGTDDRILFTSDRPRGGEAHLYPQLDEYESTPTVTGIWSLDRTTGHLSLLNHAVSGAFSPFIDSYGRVVFTRWDHLQRDQQADAGTWGAFNAASEASGAARLPTPAEVFPEPRTPSSSVFGAVHPHLFNQFTPWEVNEDGTGEQTLNHVGRHELLMGGFERAFATDGALSGYTNAGYTANTKLIRNDGGLFQMREDPLHPGTYYGLYGREFGQLGASQIVRLQGAAGMNAEQMTVVDASDPDLAEGRFRHPLPLSDGQMIASHTTGTDFTLRQLRLLASNGRYVPGPALTQGLTKSVSWYDPNSLRSHSGKLWELDPVEVVARLRPAMRQASALQAPERSVFSEVGVDEAALRSWLVSNELALIVTRNQTSRDRADRHQPYNLQVPGGTRTTGNGGKVYDISHYQVLQADQVRGYANKAGRRPLAQPSQTVSSRSVPNSTGPVGSVKIATDGSTAAFVPARRALTWQTTDVAGNPVVRERVWITLQPGEVRVCASCHGVNQTDQAGRPEPSQPPEALRQLLRHWSARAQ